MRARLLCVPSVVDGRPHAVPVLRPSASACHSTPPSSTSTFASAATSSLRHDLAASSASPVHARASDPSGEAEQLQQHHQQQKHQQQQQRAQLQQRRQRMASQQQLPRRALGTTGLSVSVLGFGASPLGSVFEAIDEEEGVAAVVEAHRLGINFFDVSPFYGATRAETVLGRGLRQLPRAEIVVSTKVGRYGAEDFDFSAERVTRSVGESCQRLGLDCIDIIQCHDIEFGSLDQVVTETIPALQKLKAEGKVRFIGITGLPLAVFRHMLDRVPAGAVDVVLSYCHCSLNDTALLPLLPYLQQKNVGVISASPLSMGLLTPQGPPVWHPAPQQVKDTCKQAAEYCKTHGISLPRLALQFATQQEGVATTLVGMCTRDQVRDNVAAVMEAVEKGGVDAAQIKAVQDILQPVLNVTWSSGRTENN